MECERLSPDNFTSVTSERPTACHSMVPAPTGTTSPFSSLTSSLLVLPQSIRREQEGKECHHHLALVPETSFPLWPPSLVTASTSTPNSSHSTSNNNGPPHHQPRNNRRSMALLIRYQSSDLHTHLHAPLLSPAVPPPLTHRFRSLGAHHRRQRRYRQRLCS